MTDILGTSVTRRRAMAGAAATGIAAVAAPAFAGPASAAEPAAGATVTPAQAAIKHVVFLMLENRSFDHLYGTLSGVRGFDDRSVARPDGGNIFAQYDPKLKTHELPFRLSQANDGQGDADLDHGWVAQHASYNGGANDNWIGAHRIADGDAKGPFTMGYYTRDDVPYHYALADAFTVCDNYFCSVLGPTYPNRLLWQMGTLDADGTGGGPLVTTDEAVFTDNSGQGVFDFKTYPEKLTAGGVTWKAYTDAASNHLLNMFPCLTQYEKATALPGTADFTNYQRGTMTSSQDQFLADANAVNPNDPSTCNLPQVSWIFPTAGQTEHPGDGAINMGPQYYGPLIAALMKSMAWKDTVLFITWDENDGYFDHVPPPTPPAGTAGEFLTASHPVFGTTTTSGDPTNGITGGITGPVGLGFRVPLLVISPFSRGGYVNSELFDHTSGLKLVETLFGVSPLPIMSQWRYDLVGDLTSTMDFTHPDLSVPDLTAAFAASQERMTPMGTETVPTPGVMPTQETTPTRPRRGPTPSFASTAPTASLPEVGAPAVLLVAGIAAATSAVAAKRIRSGGRNDAAHAGASLAPARSDTEEPTEA